MINSTNSKINHQIKHPKKLSVVILGGGTAGWMTANLMAEKWKNHIFLTT
jgi:succinate dehydrogenase/fumarate reductase flavoprotein subunit